MCVCLSTYSSCQKSLFFLFFSFFSLSGCHSDVALLYGVMKGCYHGDEGLLPSLCVVWWRVVTILCVVWWRVVTIHLCGVKKGCYHPSVWCDEGLLPSSVWCDEGLLPPSMWCDEGLLPSLCVVWWRVVTTLCVVWWRVVTIPLCGVMKGGYHLELKNTAAVSW